MSALLSSIKILDFATLLPGPAATMILADLGADVLMVESATRPDLLRILPPYVIKEKRYSYYHAFINRNKKSITLDLKNKDSLPIIEKLVREYDIIVEQFRPGVMKRLGLSYEDLKKINPKIIYCSLTGFGQTGPLKDRAAHDINYLSLAGIMSYSGRKKHGPNVMGIQLADVGGGSYNTVVGILAAVVNRMATGKGQYIDVSMTDCLFPYQGIASSREFTDEEPITYENERLNGGSLYDFYKTADGKYISFGGIEPQFFNNFCDVTGLEELKARGIDQTGCVEESKKKVAERIKTQTRDYWLEKF
jgi:crotonobetainyl-CoA:carnitine CoA-transferase CaiB-like acyl-CoA transferase